MSSPADQMLTTEELVRAVGLYLKANRRWPDGYDVTVYFEALKEGGDVRFTARAHWTLKEPGK